MFRDSALSSQSRAAPAKFLQPEQPVLGIESSEVPRAESRFVKPETLSLLLV